MAQESYMDKSYWTAKKVKFSNSDRV